MPILLDKKQSVSKILLLCGCYGNCCNWLPNWANKIHTHNIFNFLSQIHYWFNFKIYQLAAITKRLYEWLSYFNFHDNQKIWSKKFPIMCTCCIYQDWTLNISNILDVSSYCSVYFPILSLSIFTTLTRCFV